MNRFTSLKTVPQTRTPIPILALGGEQKGHFCLLRAGTALISPDFGDLSRVDNFTAYRSTLIDACRRENFRPGLIVHDLHPAYSTTRLAGILAREDFSGAATLGIQHHHAHIGSVLAEKGSKSPVLGIAWDGTGYFPEGIIGGGEFLEAGLDCCRTLVRLRPVPMPGGDRAVRDPWRMTLSYLSTFMGNDFLHLPLDFCRKLKDENTAAILEMIEKGFNSPPTSSMGRLFDGVGALLGLAWKNAAPAAAAVSLESICGSIDTAPYPFRLKKSDKPGIIETGPIFAGIIDDLRNKITAKAIAGRFHRTVIEIGRQTVRVLSAETGINQIVFSGGVFQNRIIYTGLKTHLEADGFKLYLPEAVPLHDGGIALGQAVIAAAMINTNEKG